MRFTSPGTDQCYAVVCLGSKTCLWLAFVNNCLIMNIAKYVAVFLFYATAYVNSTPIVPFRSPTAGTYGRMVPIPAGTRAHYNINNFEGPGTYKFGYDTGSGPRQSFREEERRRDGVVRGRYGYVEPSGALRVVEYRADSTGFHILKTRTMVPDMKPKPAVKVRTPFVGPLPPFIPTSYVVNLAG